jgi:hypothetical protein
MQTIRQLETELVAKPEAMHGFLEGRVDHDGSVALVGIGRSIHVLDYEVEDLRSRPEPAAKPINRYTIPLDRDFTATTYRGPNTSVIDGVDEEGITTITINDSYTILQGIRFPRTATENDPTVAAYKRYYARLHESLVRPRTIEFRPKQFAGGKVILLGKLILL